MSNNDHLYFVMNSLVEVGKEFVNCLAKHPDNLIYQPLEYWHACLTLFQSLSAEAKLNQGRNDKRFNDEKWQDELSFNIIKESYLLFCEQLDGFLIKITDNEDENTIRKLRFFIRQFTDAISPTNFVNTNPSVFSKVVQENGSNLIIGMQQFLDDMGHGKGLLNIHNTDLEFFTLGENIACTPGKIIYQNDLMQLIQYTATTPQVFQYPLLIIPPWINKYYILDLQQENSFVKWLVSKGHTIFMISWVNPTERHKEKQFADYMMEGPLMAIKQIKRLTNENKVNVLGYCIGGTLLGCTLAYLAKKKQTPILSASFLTTLFDFSEPGELGNFVDEKQISLVENLMEPTGYLHGNLMASVFNMLRSNDLIWPAFVDNYLKGQKPKPFDLLYWNADVTNIPKDVHSFYLRNMYLNNHLVQSNKIKLADQLIDLSIINIPSYFLAAQDDHIVLWKACYTSSQFYGGPVRFVLTASGHVAGVINPPYKEKYGYWINNKTPKHPAKYLTTASFYKGSWWNDWADWIKKYSGKLINADDIKNIDKKSIQNAPGSYVKVRLDK